MVTKIFTVEEFEHCVDDDIFPWLKSSYGIIWLVKSGTENINVLYPWAETFGNGLQNGLTPEAGRVGTTFGG